AGDGGAERLEAGGAAGSGSPATRQHRSFRRTRPFRDPFNRERRGMTSLTKDPPPPDPPTRRRGEVSDRLQQVRDAAARYTAQGWGVLALRAGDKMPLKAGWREPGYKATPEDFGEGHDIGVLTGAQSFVPGKGYLCCIDWDSKDALA